MFACADLDDGQSCARRSERTHVRRPDVGQLLGTERVCVVCHVVRRACDRVHAQRPARLEQFTLLCEHAVRALPRRTRVRVVTQLLLIAFVIAQVPAGATAMLVPAAAGGYEVHVQPGAFALSRRVARACR
jgi:hypothetical protein